MSLTVQDSSTELIEFLLSLVKNSPYGVLTINLAGDITMANSLSAKHFGFSIDEVIEQPVFNYIKGFRELNTFLQNCLTYGRKSSAFERCEHQGRFYSIKSNTIHNGMLITSEDVTEKIEAERLLKTMNSMLLNNNRQLEQYTYVVSHNLRAPVTNIAGLSDILAGQDIDQETRAELLKSLRSSARSLNDILSDLNLILSVKSSLSEVKQNVLFAEVLQSVTDSIGLDLAGLDIEITKDFSGQLELYTVKSYLHSILLNLMTNAIKYRQRDRKLIVNINVTAENNRHNISFSDNGLGIDLEKNKEKIFGLYKRFHNKVSEGRGIGLHLVKAHIEALGGNINVESSPMQGTKFIINL